MKVRLPFVLRYEAWTLYRPKDDHTGVNNDGRTAAEVFDAIGVERFCCRKMLLTCNPMIEQHNQYARTNIHNRKL